MKPKLVLILVLIVALSGWVTAQTNSQGAAGQGRRFLLKVGIVDESNGHTIRDCVLLLPDGHYHREHAEEQPSSFSRTPLHKSQAFETYVFEGQLTPSEVAAVADMIDQKDFRAIRKPERLRQSTQFLDGLILRVGEQPQSFILSQAADYKPNEHALKPLFSWMNSMSKRKHDVSKAEDDLCRIPDQWRPRLSSRETPIVLDWP